MANIATHRFRDFAGISVLNADGTAYLDAAGARDLAASLLKIAGSIEREKFADSPSLSASVPAFGSTTALVCIQEDAERAEAAALDAAQGQRNAESDFWASVSQATGAMELARVRGTLGRVATLNRIAKAHFADPETVKPAAVRGALAAMADATITTTGPAAHHALKAVKDLEAAFRAMGAVCKATTAAITRADKAKEAAEARKAPMARRWRLGAAEASAQALQHRRAVQAAFQQVEAANRAARAAAHHAEGVQS